MRSTAPLLTETPTHPSAARPRVRPLLSWWVALPLSAVAGFVLDLATPGVGWWPLTFVSVALALTTLIGRSVGGTLLVGGVYGAVFYATHLMWVAAYLGPVPWIALAGLEAVLFGAGAIMITLAYRWTDGYPARGAVQLFVVPALVGGLWTAREVGMGAWPYSGFPWARLGMTQVGGPFPEVASWTGVTGLSFLIAAGCAAVVQWARAGGIRRPVAAIPALAIGVLLLLVPAFPTNDAGSFRVGWVQGNGPTGYFDESASGDVLAAQTAATAPILGQPMDLLVWPEGSVDTDPLNNVRTAAALDNLAGKAGAPILVNAATTRGDSIFNTTLLWATGDARKQLHDKVNPVPFGEYVPDRWFYNLLAPDLIGLIQREYTPGTNPPAVTVNSTRVGLAICFDVIYDRVVWDGARQGAQIYVFQTNNADFRGTDENLQQLAFARMRAIETGRAVLNVSTVGTSQALAPDGTTIASAGPDTAAAAVTTLPLRTGLTPASILGPTISAGLTLSALAALVTCGIRYRFGRRPSPTPRPDTDATT
ncbi:apolipoprotein N-acyltransferase [Leifsonia sp. NCR5]|uniref:apolipoprotein N-acyltransferase n=1 Tax=Leifsonia sp. NCR5 TaxID=1978342 RepID=UPI000A1908FC|nr:apolipoprotein N-acyltransferase [Leifsonia sp. NCR5]